MGRSKYINTFNTTAEYDAYIESALPEFPNVGYDKEAGKVNIRRQSPNDYQIWGTTTATENFTIGFYPRAECTVDPYLGEFYLQGWTGTLTNAMNSFNGLSHITSIKKFAIDTSSVTDFSGMFMDCTALVSLNLSNCVVSSSANISVMFRNCNSLTDVYITEEVTLMKLTNNLTSQGTNYIPSSATIHYNDIDYKWQNNKWTPQS